MTENDGVRVSVFLKQMNQVNGRIRKVFQRKHHILDDHRRAALAHRPHRRKHSLADIPKFFLLHRIGGEERFPQQVQSLHRRLRLGRVLIGRRHIRRLKFHQQARRSLRQSLNLRRHPRLVFHRPHRCAIHQLQRRRSRLAQWHNRLASRMNAGEKQQPGVLHRQVGNRLQHRLCNKCQRSLCPDQQMAEYLHRRRKIEKRIQRIAGGVLHLVLRTDPPCNGRVPLKLAFQLKQPCRQLRLARPEPRIRIRRGSIDHRARGQHEGHRAQRVIRVLHHAATHPTRIIRENSTQPRRADRCWVRPDLRPVKLQHLVSLLPNQPRLHPQQLAVLFHLCAAPVAPHVHQDSVCNCLAR